MEHAQYQQVSEMKVLTTVSFVKWNLIAAEKIYPGKYI